MQRELFKQPCFVAIHRHSSLITSRQTIWRETAGFGAIVCSETLGMANPIKVVKLAKDDVRILTVICIALRKKGTSL
jgi:hypothetical protein